MSANHKPVSNLATTFIDCAQRSEEWFSARLGRLTGSRAADMLATLKSGAPAQARLNYQDELVTERLTGLPDDDDPYISRAMQRGIDCEALAFDRYEAISGASVHTSGFLACDDIMAGASLDGHITQNGVMVGILEIKCLDKRNHMALLRGNVIPDKYLPQLVHNLWVSGADWVDFMAYDDRFPKPMQTFIQRLNRTSVDIQAYETKALEFLRAVDKDTVAIAEAWKV